MLQEDVNVTSTGGMVTIHIPWGTMVLNPDGEPLDKILGTLIYPPPTPPEGCHVIAAFDFEPSGSTFDFGIAITVPYDPDALPEGVDEANLAMAFFNDETNEWEFVTGVVNTDAKTLTVWINHFSVYGFIGKKDATFTFSDLSISPGAVGPGESVRITAQITNSGGMEGNCTIALLIDGAVEETKEVTLGPGESDIIASTVTRDILGTYAVEVGGLTDAFAVRGPFSWGLVGGILGLLAVAATTVYFVVFRRKRAMAQAEEGQWLNRDDDSSCSHAEM